jgi:hypothetical protein
MTPTDRPIAAADKGMQMPQTTTTGSSAALPHPHAKPIGPVQIAASAVIGVVVLGGLGYLAWRLAGHPGYASWYEIARTVLFAFAAAGALPAGLIAYRRQRTLEMQRQDARDQYHLSVQTEARLDAAELKRQREREQTEDRNRISDLRKRYTEAAEQLGHDKAAVRLAGVYAMAHLANDWDDLSQRQTCIDVLCAYVRSTVSSSSSEEDREVVRTVIRTITQYLQPAADNTPGLWSGLVFDFTGAVIPEGSWNFAHVMVTGGILNFRNARFAAGSVVTLVGSTFDNEATLTFDGVRMAAGSSANLAGCTVGNATVTFEGAKLETGANISLGGGVLKEGGLVAFDRITLPQGSQIVLGGTTLEKGSSITFDLVDFKGGVVVTEGMSVQGGTISRDGGPFGGTNNLGVPR